LEKINHRNEKVDIISDLFLQFVLRDTEWDPVRKIREHIIGMIPKQVEEGCRFGSGWLNEDSLIIRMIMTFLSQCQDNEPNNVRYFAWLADGNDAISWMCI